MSMQTLSELVTGRKRSLFEDDMDARVDELRESLRESRILVIGGAGSIGSATVRLLIGFPIEALHVDDQNENGLTELVRDLRSSGEGLAVRDFRTLPVDYGSPIMRHFLHVRGPYDYILNFAALKHVRSEKDVHSLLQMLATNIHKQHKFLQWLSEVDYAGRYFSVSTDKAADPVNFMGASKRLMEHLLFSHDTSDRMGGAVTSARFANVAFSDGSLLDGFLRRLEKKQPLAVPIGIQRYFVSLTEAAQICVLAACLGPHRHLLIPRLSAGRDLVDLQAVAGRLVHHFDFEPVFYQEESQARTNMLNDLDQGRYPILLTKPDTSGEKPSETFVAQGESVVDVGFIALQAVTYRPAPEGMLSYFLGELEHWLVEPGDAPDKAGLARILSCAVNEFHHVKTDKSLDERM